MRNISDNNGCFECLSYPFDSEGATPKAVLRLMGVQGITIYHVKSHLQVCPPLPQQIGAGSWVVTVIMAAEAARI